MRYVWLVAKRQKETKGANQSMVIGNISVVKCAKKARNCPEAPLARLTNCKDEKYLIPPTGQFRAHLVLK